CARWGSPSWYFDVW
nr:immunoglobulin heavy chain junction region [Mus musculus]